MANSSRRYIDKNGNMFVPMNVEGGSWNEHFMTTPKLVALAVSIFTAIALVAWLKGRFAGTSAYIIIMGLWAVGFQFVLRYVIFEEKFYYRMYKNLKQSEISTPAIFWDIASIKDSDDGALLTYADGKIGVIVKIERDTITGKNTDFKEEHYDAISDFYKEIMDRKYSFVQMNIMEQAGNDPRLAELDKLTYKNENANICKLMEKQVGYIKNITHRTLYESDYVLIYTKDLTKMDAIINETIECVYKIMDGAFIGYRILKSRDIIEFIKEEYGVKYFNYTEATLSMFKNHGMVSRKPFDISDIVFSSGEVQKIGNRELNIINTLTSSVLNGTLDIDKISIKEAILSNNDNKEKFGGIDFDSLSEGFDMAEQVESKPMDRIKNFTRKKKNDNAKNVNSQVQENEETESSSDLGTFEEASDDTFNNSANGTKGKNQQVNNKKEVPFGNFNDDDENIDF